MKRCRSCDDCRPVEAARSFPDWVYSVARRSRYVTPDLVHALYLAQNRRCAVCGAALSAGKKLEKVLPDGALAPGNMILTDKCRKGGRMPLVQTFDRIMEHMV